MKKAMLWVLIAVMMVTMVTGCSNGGSANDPANTPTATYGSVRGGYATLEKKGTPVGDFLRLEFSFPEERTSYFYNDAEVMCDAIFAYELWEECAGASDEVLAMETGDPVGIDGVDYYNLVFGVDTTGVAQLVKEENGTVNLHLSCGDEMDITFKRTAETKLEVVAVSKAWTPIANSDYAFLSVGDVFTFEPAE